MGHQFTCFHSKGKTLLSSNRCLSKSRFEGFFLAGTGQYVTLTGPQPWGKPGGPGQIGNVVAKRFLGMRAYEGFCRGTTERAPAVHVTSFLTLQTCGTSSNPTSCCWRKGPEDPPIATVYDIDFLNFNCFDRKTQTLENLLTRDETMN